MLRDGLCVCCLLFVVWSAASQQPETAYYPYAYEREESAAMLLPDSTIFYRAIHGASDLYARITDFRLSFVPIRRRGQERRTERVSAEGLELPYRYFGALRLLGAGESTSSGLTMMGSRQGSVGGVREFRLTDATPLPGHTASVHFTDRNYLFGAKTTFTTTFGRGWSGQLAPDVRTGRDMYVDGVFTNAFTVALRASKRYAAGHSLDFVAVVPTSVRGVRSASSEEAFRLTDNRLYNPSWGFQNGKVRNSNVRREFVPLLMAAGRWQLSPTTTLCTALGAEYGLRSYSALGWYDARTPIPDNYRYMPSYTADRETDQAWRDSDPHHTQIDWDELISRNRLAGGAAVYALEDRVERLSNLHFDAMLTTVLDPRVTLHYGLYYRRLGSRHYKQMRDLLGARFLTDIDQYLIDDDTYANLLQNDLRHPDRQIRQGDRFGYHYGLSLREAGVRMTAEYRSDRLRADVGVMLGDAAVRRRGYYEKELFPGARSFGLSRRMRFLPYTLKAQAGWAFTPNHYIEFNAMAASSTPDAEDLFCQPQYNNRTIEQPVAERTYAVEVNYRTKTRVVNLQATAFWSLTLDEVHSRRYFDDLSGVFCDMTVSGIGTEALGLEAAADIRLSYRWSLSLAASAGCYRYVRNPRVTVIADADNAVVDNRAESYMGGCRLGGAPQLSGVAELAYFAASGWGFRLSAAYAGGRYVEPMPLRRTLRVARQGSSSPEAFAAFTSQERLNDAFRLDASLFKSFRFDDCRLTLALMLRNLLGDRDTVYGGFESLRVRRMGSGVETSYAPHASRYTYAYPRSFYLTISYKF